MALTKFDTSTPNGAIKATNDIESVAPGVWRLVLGTPEAITPVSVRRSAPQWEGIQHLPQFPKAPPIGRNDIFFRAHARGCTVELPYHPDEAVFGFGLQLKGHLHSGKKRHLRVNADPTVDTGDSHAPAPFYLSTHGYGVLADTARYSSFYVGTHAARSDIRERVAQKANQAPTNTTQIYRSHAFGFKTVIDIPTAQGLTLYFFAGPSMLNALQRYVFFSGGGCLPPLAELGNWYRAYSSFDDKSITKLINDFEANNLPFNVIGLEPAWQSHFYPNSFAWSQHFPDPVKFTQELKRRNYLLNLWENAFVHPDAPFANEIEPWCSDQLSTDGLAPDFLTPQARDIFARHHRDVLVDNGIAGFKLDECDNGDFIPFAWSFPEHSHFPSGADGEQMHSLYGIHYQHTLDSIFKEKNQRHYGLVRSSGPLSAPLPYVLYSDLYDHKDFLRGLVNAGYSAMLWTPEVRDATSPEDLIRRTQAVILSPLSVINAWYIPMPPWQQVDKTKNERGELMDEASWTTDLIRQALHLRMKLLPYLYTAFAKYAFEGIPPVRGLPLDYPKDKATWMCDQQFMLGPDIIAAPIPAGQNHHKIYLPAGQWREFSTGRLHQGAQYLVLENPSLDLIPLYVRDGALLPLAASVAAYPHNQNYRIRPTIYGTQAAQGSLYEDDGRTFDYQMGNYNWLDLSWTKSDGLQFTRRGTQDFQAKYIVLEPQLMAL